MIIDTNTLFGFYPRGEADTSVETLLSQMDRAGVDRALTCSYQGCFYDAGEGNDETLRVCAQHRQRLIPVGTLNPSAFYGLDTQIAWLCEQGVKLVRFFPAEQEWRITERHFTRLLDKLADTPLALMLPSTAGLTAIAQVAKGFKNAVLIESLRLYPHLAELIAVMQDTENLFIETHLIGSCNFFEVLTAHVGLGRIVFGSGAPLHSYQAALLPIQNAAVDDEAKQAALGGTISRILGL